MKSAHQHYLNNQRLRGGVGMWETVGDSSASAPLATKVVAVGQGLQSLYAIIPANRCKHSEMKQ